MLTRTRRLFSSAIFLSLAAQAALGGTAHAATYEIHDGEDLWARLRTLAAGDEVIVHAGTYAQSSRFEATWAGTAAMPIVVRAAEGEARPVLTRDAGQNLMNLHGSYFTLRGFELSGGSHAIRMSDVDHATLEDLVIHGTGDVGISCNIPDAGADPNGCSELTIRRNEIYDTDGTGEGMYLGCNDGACVFRDSLIEQNYVHDLGGSQGDGIEIKGGSYGNVVRDNVIVRANYPGITVYSFDPGAGRMPNVIERNLVWHTSDNGIQVTGRAIVRNNVVIDAGASGIASQMNQGTPSDLTVVNNTVVGAGDRCFRANDWNGRTGFVVANNAFYCPGGNAMRISDASGATFAGNVVLGAVEGVSTGFTTGASLAADLGPDAATARVYPPAGSALLDAGDATHAPSDDFDLRPRPFGAGPDVGAYERDASGMPAWLAEEGFKVLGGAPMPGTDGGAPGGDGGAMPGADGGSTSADGGGTPADGGGTMPGADGGGATGGEGDGCGCRAAGAAHARDRSGATAIALGAALALLVVRRRASKRG